MVGLEDGLGVECLSGSGAIAGIYTKVRCARYACWLLFTPGLFCFWGARGAGSIAKGCAVHGLPA